MRCRESTSATDDSEVLSDLSAFARLRCQSLQANGAKPSVQKCQFVLGLTRLDLGRHTRLDTSRTKWVNEDDCRFTTGSLLALSSESKRAKALVYDNKDAKLGSKRKLQQFDTKVIIAGKV